MKTHTNSGFLLFVDLLSDWKNRFKKSLLGKVIDHTPEQFRNWLRFKSKIRPEYFSTVNKQAEETLKPILLALLPEVNEEEFHLNLFLNKMSDSKTTIFLERAKQRWTQEKLAEVAKVSVTTIQRFENSDNQFLGYTSSTAKKIADAFGLNVSDFREFQL